MSGVDGAGDAGFTDDFLNMMAGGGQLAPPKPANLKFTGEMQEAFKMLTDAMYKKASAPLASHGKFKQTYAEAADELRRATDFDATEFDTKLASQINNDLSATVEATTPSRIKPQMKEEKGAAFKLLVNAIRKRPNEQLYKHGKAGRTNAQAATELEKAKGLECDHDEPNLSQEIHSKLSKLVDTTTPSNLKTDMAETLDVTSKYLSKRAVDENERGPAFDAMIKELEKSGANSFTPEYPALATNNAAANALKNAPGLTVSNPDKATAPMFVKALHNAVDAATPPNLKNEMKEVADRSGDYLSTMARDRSSALELLLKMMKNSPGKELAKRNNFTLDYGTGATELQAAPTLIPYLPVKDIADEIKTKLTTDMEISTPPALKMAMKALIKDASGHLSQLAALKSGAAGDRYPLNLQAAIMKSLGKRPLYKHKGHGQTYADAAEVLKFAGVLEEDPKCAQLAHDILAEINKGISTVASPTFCGALQGTMDSAAKHLAKIGTEKGEALQTLIELMKKKGHQPIGMLQGYQQTYTDCAVRLENATSLANDKVDKGAYELVRSKLKALVPAQLPADQAKLMDETLIDEAAKYLAAPFPDNEMEKRQVLADQMSKKRDEILGEDGIYKMTYQEGAEEIMNGSMGKTKDQNKKKVILDQINVVIPGQKLKEVLKVPANEGAAHLTDIIKGRGDAMNAICNEMRNEPEKQLINIGNANITQGQAADMLATANHFSGGEAPQELVDQVKGGVSALNTKPATQLGKDQMDETRRIASKYIAGEAVKESGLDEAGLAAAVGRSAPGTSGTGGGAGVPGGFGGGGPGGAGGGPGGVGGSPGGVGGGPGGVGGSPGGVGGGPGGVGGDPGGVDGGPREAGGGPRGVGGGPGGVGGSPGGVGGGHGGVNGGPGGAGGGPGGVGGGPGGVGGGPGGVGGGPGGVGGGPGGVGGGPGRVDGGPGGVGGGPGGAGGGSTGVGLGPVGVDGGPGGVGGGPRGAGGGSAGVGGLPGGVDGGPRGVGGGPGEAGGGVGRPGSVDGGPGGVGGRKGGGGGGGKGSRGGTRGVNEQDGEGGRDGGGRGKSRRSGGAGYGTDSGREPSDAERLLQRQLRARGDETFYQQPQTQLTHAQAADRLARPSVPMDKSVRESGDTARLSKKFEKKLSDLVSDTTPPEMTDEMQDVIIESSRKLSEYFVSNNYKALVREALISGMQKRGNEILIQVDGAAETSFFAAQRLKKEGSLIAKEPCNQIACHLTKKLEEVMKCATMPRKLAFTMKDHIKDVAEYLSEYVTKPDEEIEAYVSLVGEMDVAGDKKLFENNIKKSFKDCALYLRQLTSNVDKINLPNGSMQSDISGRLKSLMGNDVARGYSSSVLDKMIGESTKFLVSYIMLQEKKTEALKVLISKMDEVGDKVLLRHGSILKPYTEAAAKLRGKNTDKLAVESADPVVARKIHIKLDNLMGSAQNISLMSDVIEDATKYLAVNLLEPRIINVCKCMKSVFVQCELWCEEILRRMSQPSCTCSRHAIASSPSRATASAFLPGLDIHVTGCSSQRDTDRAPCPATASGRCHATRERRGDTTSYLLYDVSPTRLSAHNDEQYSRKSEFSRGFSDCAAKPYFDEEPTFSSAPEHRDDSDSNGAFYTAPSTNTEREGKNVPFWQEPTAMVVWPLTFDRNTALESDARSDRSGGSQVRCCGNFVTTDQMSDWHAMIVSLMWNVQAWRSWLQENIDRALLFKPRQVEGQENWQSYQKRVAKEALQWHQYNAFSSQLTQRLALRYRDKHIVSPTRATVKTQSYMECQREMLNIIDMFNRWTHWFTAVLKETSSLEPPTGVETPLDEQCWEHYKRKVEEHSSDWNKYNIYLKTCWEHKYKMIISDWLPGWQQTGPVWVVSACGAVPSGAVAAGLFQNEVTWLARTTYRCNVLPAALVPSKHSCLVYTDGGVHKCTKYQVMCNASVRWVGWRAGEAGQVCARAVRVAPGVFVGRVLHRGDHLVGAVLAPHNRCHVVMFGRPFAFNCYELLVLANDE